ncbi:type II secretion system F family protein [Lysinibacillus sp. VIII_CA]|uniref:type II secretion system F family protein n=1 Tax=Lysinibacillus sp. VIII_CA TaxID=3417452 RepID=UPI003CF12CBD
MSVTFTQILQVVFLITIGIVFYQLLRRVEISRKNFRHRKLARVLKNQEEEKSAFNWLKDKKIRRFVDFKLIAKEAEIYGYNIKKTQLMMNFIIGGALAAIFNFLYFNKFPFLLPVAVILGGYIAINLKLHKFRKAYLISIEGSITIYMTSMTTAIKTFRNLKESLNSVIPSLEQPVRNEVNEAYLKLQDGKSVKEAFEAMNDKYQIKELKHFNNQLEIINKTGDFNDDSLRKITFKMQKKKKWRRDILREHKQSKKTWRQFVFMSLSIPIVIYFFMNDSFIIIRNSMIMNFAYMIVFAYIYFTWKSLERLEIYDVTTNDTTF